MRKYGLTEEMQTAEFMKMLFDSGFYHYDLVLIMNMYIGSGLTFPLSKMQFTVNYRNSSKGMIEEVTKMGERYGVWLSRDLYSYMLNNTKRFFSSDVDLDEVKRYEVPFGYTKVIRFGLTESKEHKMILGVKYSPDDI